jgi:hypothetical protein
MPGSAGEIRIVSAYLETLAAQAEATAAMLDGAGTTMSLTFPGNPEVDDAYGDFVARWDKHRDDLRAAVTAVAEAFRAVVAAFDSCEAQLIAALGP